MKGEILYLGEIFPRGDNLKEHPLQVFKATPEPYAMYLHKAIKEPDEKKFITSMVKELKYQI